MQSEKEQQCAECVRPNCNGQSHLTEDVYLGCSQCGIELNDIIELLECASLRSSDVCEICDHTYLESESQDEHFMAHFYVPPVKVFLCMDCESHTSSDSLVIPIKVVFHCETCGDVFTTNRILNRHRIDVHAIHKNYPCRDCQNSFKSKSRLAYHRKRKHPKAAKLDDVYPCRVCERVVYGSKAERNSHENQTHRDPETRQFSCPHCDQLYPNASFLENHMLKHTQRKSHTCDVCGKAFSRLGHMEYHRSTHTDMKLFECYMCDGKAFKTVQSLKLHLNRMHTANRPGYPCEQCGKVFKDTSDRRRHRWTHGGTPKNFACEMCPKRFYERKALRFHMRVHSKVTTNKTDSTKLKVNTGEIEM